MYGTDYMLLAEVFRNRWCNNDDDPHECQATRQWALLVRKMARALAIDNPNFKQERFYKACGYDPAIHDKL